MPGGQFKLPSYAALLNPEEWAKKAGMFGGNKKKLAEDFLKWQKKSIHSYMINHPFADKKTHNTMKKLLKTCFKTVLFYMGVKKSSKTEPLVSQVLSFFLDRFL